MIIRPPQHWFRRLFVWHGSVLPNIVFRLFLNAAMAVLAIALLPWYEESGVRLTLGPFSLLGVAIAIFLGFRNNTAYARFDEARQLWGALLVSTRSLVRQVKSVLPDEADARTFANLLTAFAWCLNHQLRGADHRPDLERLIPETYRETIAASPMPANRVLLCIGLWLGEKRRSEAISDIVYAGIDHNLDELSRILGGCERIAGTPIPFAYSLILYRTVYLFCTLLPFALVEDLKYMTPLVSVFISYTFLSLEAVAEELEDPFGTAPNDLPLNALCTVIERNLGDMTGSQPIPALLRPDHRFNLS
jgi:putative membrane protein